MRVPPTAVREFPVGWEIPLNFRAHGAAKTRENPARSVVRTVHAKQ